MKNKWIIGVLCSMVICLNGCHLLPHTYPTGTWKSEDGKIIINFSEYGFSENAGTIELDQEVVSLYWMILDIDCLSIYKSTALVDTVVDDSEYYFDGYLRYSYEENAFTVKVIDSQISQYPEDSCFLLVPCEGAGTTTDSAKLPSSFPPKTPEIYSRTYADTICSGIHFGNAQTDDIYTALEYIYQNEELNQKYGDSFEVSDIKGNSNCKEFNLLFFQLFEGTGKYDVTICEDEWTVELSKNYLGKWKVTQCYEK